MSRHPSRETKPPGTTSTLAPAPGTFESESEPSREPAPKSGTKPPGTTSTLAPAPGTLNYAPTTVYLDEIDREAMKHVFNHRDKADMAWGMGDEKDEKKQNDLRSLAESLLEEGQLTPIEFYRDEQGRAVLVRGYRVVEAYHQIIDRELDPARCCLHMPLLAVQLSGGREADYLVRAVASNEVHRHLSETAKYTVAEMMLRQGVPAIRAARALAVSPSLFARYIRRYHNPWMLEHVAADHLTLTDADALLEAAGTTNSFQELKTAFQAIVEQVEAHIKVLRAKAKLTKQKWDEEKQGKVKYYTKDEIKDWCKALKEEKPITIDLREDDNDDFVFECKIDDKDGRLKLNGLNNLALHQLDYVQLAAIAGKLGDVAGAVLQVFKQKQEAKKQGEAARLSSDARLLAFYKEHGADDLAKELERQIASGNGQSDPNHGKTTPRTETPVTAVINVPPQPELEDGEQPEYDAAIDGGPDQ